MMKMVMMMMMMMMVVVLSGVLCDSAEVLHEDINLIGCSDSDGENLYGLDGEEIWFADFKQKRGVEPQPSFIDHMTYEEGTYEQAVANLQICKQNLKIDRKAYKDFPLERDPPSSPMIYPRDKVEPGEKNVLICHVTGFFPTDTTATCTAAPPSVVLSSMTPPGGKHSSMLVCSIFDFFPQKIKVSWTRDGLPETSGVTSTDELADGDWYYQVHSHLEYTPRSGEKISCVVEHFSLSKPLVTDWDPSMPESERNKIAIGASGLVLGLTLSLAGFIYYQRKARGGRILVPNN